MDQFFTWQFLASFGGCIIGTGLLVQFFKGMKPFSLMKTQVFSYLVALIVYNAAGLALGNWTPGYLGLSFINAVLIALASNGGYEAISNISSLFSKPSDTAQDNGQSTDQ